MEGQNGKINMRFQQYTYACGQGFRNLYLPISQHALFLVMFVGLNAFSLNINFSHLLSFLCLDAFQGRSRLPYFHFYSREVPFICEKWRYFKAYAF